MTDQKLTAKGSARRDLILDAASAILIEDGHAALTLRAVAGQAQIRLGNLQYYFATRAGLVSALLERQLDQALERLKAPLAARDVEDLVRQLLADQCDRSLTVLFTELWALAGHDTGVGAAVQGFYRRYQALVADVILERRPTLPPAEALTRAKAFVTLIEGAAVFRSGIAADRDDEADALLSATATALLQS